MQKSLQEVGSIVAQWEALESAQPDGFSSEMPDILDMDFESFSKIFARWKERLDSLQKSKWLEEPESNLADTVLSKQFSAIGALIAQASTHGVPWLMSSGFIQQTADAGQRLAILADRRAGIARAIAKELKREGVEQLQQIVQAGPNARSISAQAASAKAALGEFEQASAATEERLQTLNQEADQLDGAKATIAEALKFASEKRAEIEGLHTEVVSFRSQSETKAGEFERRLGKLTEEVDAAKLKTTEANAGLTRALADVRRQGLAGAFSDRGKKIAHERWVWLGIFGGSVVWLALIAQQFAVQLTSFTFEALTVALLRRAALAAPLVWLGWYAAKQLGRLARVKEDYEYKAATALAFESYKHEVEASENDELLGELLSTTISNFGDNPVRLYEATGKHDPATPTEDLLSQMEANGTLKAFARLSNFFVPKG